MLEWKNVLIGMDDYHEVTTFKRLFISILLVVQSYNNTSDIKNN